MNDQIVSALIQGGATFVGAGFAAWAVIVQIGRQARNAIRQARHDEGLRLKLNIYREITGICGEQEDANVTLESDLRLLHTMLGQELDPDWPNPPGAWRGPTWHDLAARRENLFRTSIAVITHVERWQIIEPRVDLFKLAMNVALHDVTVAWQEFIQCARILPPAHLAGGAWLPPLGDFPPLQEATMALLPPLSKLGAWVSDFQVEMQSVLLGELFERRLAPREPIDPAMFAIRFDQYETLKHHLETDTPWAKQKQEIETAVRKHFAG